MMKCLVLILFAFAGCTDTAEPARDRTDNTEVDVYDTSNRKQVSDTTPLVITDSVNGVY